MATQTLRCERHGEATRITCVDCGQPICPRCAIRTEVGLKCEPCGQPVAVAATSGLRSRQPLLLLAAGVVVLAIAVFLVLRPSGGPPPARSLPPVGSWSSAPALSSIRGTTTAVVLKDGKLLVAGGGVGAIPLAAAELFDARSGQWRPTGPLTQARRGHQAVVLQDGRVLIAGGIAEGGLLASAEVYDPPKGSWEPTASMATARLGHSLTLLADGRVLAAGGTASGGSQGAGGGQTIRPEGSAEIYDPRSRRWTPAGALSSARFEHTATLLPDGRVLLAGGLGPTGDGVAPLASSEIYDPAANAFLRSTDMAEARSNHAAVLVSERKVLLVGGAGGANADVSLASAEVFDPGEGAWSRVDALGEGRAGHSATSLADGRALVAGGESLARGSRRSLVSAEIFDPASGEWRSAGKMSCPRSEQAAALLPDNSALVVGGDAAFPGKAPVAQSCADQFRP